MLKRVGQGAVLTSPVFERIAQPTITDDGRKAPALRFGDPRVHALASALCSTLHAITGTTNKSPRALMTGLLGTPYTTNQASYDLAQLRHNRLINHTPHHNHYTLTKAGLAFTIFYTKIHDRLLRPLTAIDQPQAPPVISTALRIIDHHINHQLADARPPTAA